jgi:hypothetical protein
MHWVALMEKKLGLDIYLSHGDGPMGLYALFLLVLKK